ncbi:hypothetical protein FIBSPDRAFT_488613 [Athelia psychrophila]|uniref:Uncharacterized protein n=1 Tax=Athelia psychrophila TaxID=1759441 RepID=A0A166KSD7_9AGAM|nr:hypothetical protein FIBSPDRAFT_488613 [Fibularhizoctonia sp. CBS 109695]
MHVRYLLLFSAPHSRTYCACNSTSNDSETLQFLLESGPSGWTARPPRRCFIQVTSCRGRRGCSSPLTAPPTPSPGGCREDSRPLSAGGRGSRMPVTVWRQSYACAQELGVGPSRISPPLLHLSIFSVLLAIRDGWAAHVSRCWVPQTWGVSVDRCSFVHRRRPEVGCHLLLRDC